MEKKVLILGGTGLLGKAVLESSPNGFKLITTHLRDLPKDIQCGECRQLNVAHADETRRLFEDFQPHIVIHMAGVGSVDFAEKHQRDAWIVNVQGTQNVIDCCRMLSAKLIYISSNAVFDGNTPPYDENSIRRPVNYYGQLKIEAEERVQSSDLKYVIIRPILMYGWHYVHARENPVTMWLRMLGEGKALKVVDDRFWQPLYVDDCAKLIWAITQQEKLGIYNISGPDRISLYELALKTTSIFGYHSSLVEPVPSSFFVSIAPRPVDTSFLLDKIHRELGIVPVGVETGLERMKSVRTNGG